MTCPYCGAAVNAGAEVCAQCGSRIEWDGEDATFETPGTLVRVFTAWEPTSLPVIESLLEANGIPFEVANEVTQDFFSWGRLLAGHNPAFGPPVVKVPADREAEARELIEAAASAPLPAESADD